MKVILLFFLCAIIFILGIIFSKIKIKIKTMQNLSQNDGIKIEFEIIIYIYFFYLIKAIKFKINSSNKKTKKRGIRLDKNIIKIIKNSKLRLEYLLLDIDLDTTNIITTTFATVIISTIILIFLGLNAKLINSEKCKYKVNPLYQNKNLINLNLNCMIIGDFVHISNIVYKYLKCKE